MITCSMHSRAKAAWRCTECHKDLCPDCAASGESQSGAVVRCKHCGALAIPLMEHREIQPYWKMFPAFLGAIVSLEGLLQILAVAVVMYLVSFIPLLGGLLSLSLWIAYYFSVIRKAAFGAERLPTISDFENPLDDMVAPLLRFVLASLILWAPTVWYIASHPDLVFVIKKPLLLFTDPVLILIMLAGILYFPGTIITAAIS
ncbi:MAG: hypothetical protein JXR96_18620, partial [Deltaproteobacteria bacterium]|nr:hypothetical protein [Deltaproteobacteria bacterium]